MLRVQETFSETFLRELGTAILAPWILRALCTELISLFTVHQAPYSVHCALKETLLHALCTNLAPLSAPCAPCTFHYALSYFLCAPFSVLRPLSSVLIALYTAHRASCSVHCAHSCNVHGALLLLCGALCTAPTQCSVHCCIFLAPCSIYLFLVRFSVPLHCAHHPPGVATSPLSDPL